MVEKNTSYKIRSWRNTIDQLMQEQSIDLQAMCDYMGTAYNADGPSFYVKLPKKRNVYIGAGMALHQPIDVINSWIVRYAGKRKLYVKDISEDLVWAYLIEANRKDDSGTINYYKRYEEFQSVAFATFRERWDEIVLRFEDTADVETSLAQAEYGPDHTGIRDFVAAHMDAFKSAYAKPREYLDKYVNCILDICRRNPEYTNINSLSSMRGYLDDSMVNFLSGDSGCINVIDKKTGKRTVRIKHVPKGRKKYISLCLALGMTVPDINTYLGLMGYGELDPADTAEGRLIAELTIWEHEHPLQRLLKNRYFDGDETITLTDREEIRAVGDMLMLRAELNDIYKAKNLEFPYMIH